MKTLGNATSDEERLQQLAKTYVELERDHNKQASSLKQNEKVLEKELREKEHLQREYNKSVLIRFERNVHKIRQRIRLSNECLLISRDKLEQVCREQQKLMKSIKSESMTKIRDEEEKRKETQAHFQQSINEIFTTLGKNNDENLKIKEANAEMTKKFKYLAEQYELREKQLEKMNEQIKLETQLHEAKLAKVQMEATIQKEILLKEKEAALEEILVTKKAIVEMETRERLLKEQLTMYTEKYDQFQMSLQKSNDVFVTYKVEIEKMSKKTKLFEKEACEWRSKYEKSNRALLNMLAEKQTQDDYVKKSARQLAQLQKLCRTLQAERGVMLDVLKANNIERPAMPELPPEPKDIEPAPQPNDKLDMMSRNCKELKETLAQLQSQMNAITTEKSDKEKTEVNPKKQKVKKNKSKKDSSNKIEKEHTVNGVSEISNQLENVSINGNTTTPNDNTASEASKEIEIVTDETVEPEIESPIENNNPVEVAPKAE